MKKSEFDQCWSKEILQSIRVVVGEKTNIPYSINCYKKDDMWIICEIGERQDVLVIIEGEESMVFDQLDRMVQGELKLQKRRNM